MNAFKFLALVVLLTFLLAVVACGAVSQDSTGGGAPHAASPADAPPAQGPVTSSAVPTEVTQPACAMTPLQTEGPYYFDAGQVRRDITEGKSGTPLLVVVHLVEAGSCAAIRDAVVDIWHPDAAG